MKSTPSTADIRTWAQNNGFTVGERGRLPDELHAAYRRAHNRTAGRVKATARASKTKAPAAATSSRPAVSTVKPTRSRGSAAKPSVKPPAKAQPDERDLAARVTRLEVQLAALHTRLDTAAKAPSKRRSVPQRGK